MSSAARRDEKRKELSTALSKDGRTEQANPVYRADVVNNQSQAALSVACTRCSVDPRRKDPDAEMVDARRASWAGMRAVTMDYDGIPCRQISREDNTGPRDARDGK